MIKVWRKKLLLERIKLKKRLMYMKVSVFGFTDPRVVEHSQELDVLINRYQKIY